MQKTKIEWCDFTWNPVWGCRNECPYCYARKLAHRWGKSFEPHWVEKNFLRPMPEEPSRIFVNSMSDIAFWQLEWVNAIMWRIRLYSEHRFLFLTKNPEVYTTSHRPQCGWAGNCWLGATATNEAEVVERQNYFVGPHISFLSLEPLHGPIPGRAIDIDMVDWLVIGAETGNRKDKIVPKREWIEELVARGKPVFMKDSLKPIWGENLVRQWPK